MDRGVFPRLSSDHDKSVRSDRGGWRRRREIRPVTDPLSLRCDAEQVLGDDQAQQLDIAEDGFATRMTGSRIADRRQDPIVKMDVECGQEGIEVSLHPPNLTPSVND
jgi:hypothetical protein